MRETVDGLLAKAQECLDPARSDLAAGRMNSASNRAYYTMFHAARAALEFHDIVTDNARHSGVLQQFGLHLIRSGRLDNDHGRNINKARVLRNKADYDADPPDRVDVERMVRNAEGFLGAIVALISHASEPQD